MIDLSNYSCDKCAREFSRHCKHCYHTVNKAPTKFKKKEKTGYKTPEIKEWKFENSKNVIVTPNHDKLNEWKDSDYIPYNDEILIGYNDIKVVYKVGDGIHKWNELPEVSLEEALSCGYVYHTPWKYRIKLEFIPTRTMRSKGNDKCKD